MTNKTILEALETLESAYIRILSVTICALKSVPVIESDVMALEMVQGDSRVKAAKMEFSQAAAEQPTKKAAQPIKEQASRAGEQKAIADALAEILRAHRLHPYLRVGEYGAIQSAYRFLAEARSRQPDQAAEQPEKEGDYLVIDWSTDGREDTALSVFDSIAAEYRTTCGKPAPDAEMAATMRRVKHRLLDWWGCYREEIHAALSAHHPDSGEWVSVKDRLPERDQPCIVVCDGRVEIAARRIPWKNMILFHGQSGSHMQVTHWQPLPPAPKDQP